MNTSEYNFRNRLRKALGKYEYTSGQHNIQVRKIKELIAKYHYTKQDIMEGLPRNRNNFDFIRVFTELDMIGKESPRG